MKLSRPAALLTLSVCLSLAWLVFAPEPLLAQAEPGGANGGRKLTGDLTTGMSGRTWRISSDGEHVVFTSGVQDQIGLYSVPVDGRSKPVLLGANLTEAWAERYTISANGQWVYYLASPAGSSVLINELVVAPVSGGMTTTLFGPAPYIEYWLTPDQTQIVASAHVTESSDSANLYVLPVQDWGVASITATQLVTGIVHYRANLTLVAPDGETVLFASWDGLPMSERATLYAVPTGGGAVRTLTEHLSLATFAASPQFSPDGAMVVYPGDASGTCALCAVKVATGQTVDLVPYTAGFGIVDAPQISPDGEYVVFQASPRTQGVALKNLFSVPLAGGAINTLATVLEDGGGVYPVVFAPDSKSVLYRFERNSNGAEVPVTELRITAIDHADSRLIAVPMGQNQVLGRLIETGDGMSVRVALWQRLVDGSYTVVALYRVGYEDGAVELLGEFGPSSDGRGAIDDYHLALSNDGAWIGYLQYDGSVPNTKLFVQPVGGSEAQRVDAADAAYARVIGFAMDPKSRYVVYNANQDGMGKDALYASYFPDDLKLPVIRQSTIP